MANGGIIGPVNIPTSTTATGVWQQEEQYEARVTDTWPERPLFTTKSLRFNEGSSDYLNRTPASAGNRKTWTYSTWIKRSNIANNTITSCYSAGNDSDIISIIVRSTGEFRISAWTINWRVANRLFRDVSAWYHIVVAIDTTQATANDRIKVYVNGVQETSFSTINNPSLNQDIGYNQASTTRVGAPSNALNNFFDGYMSETVFIDGTALDPTSFGVANSDGVWTPIPYTGTFGNNGFNLQFENSAALGTDSSPNGNTFTVNNLTSIDQTTDYPVVNYATFNPLTNRSGTTATHSEGNLKVVWSGGTNTPSMGTIGVQSGKWYYESKMFWGSNSYIGITYDSTPTNTDVKGYLLRQTGEKYDAFTGSGSSYTSALSSGDTVMIAFDADNGTLWFGVNGTWSNSATQTEIEDGTTTNSAFSSIDMSYIWLPMGKGGVSSNARIEANFGNPIYTISSGNTDGNGYGNFEYAVPSGYYALNTANLAEFG